MSMLESKPDDETKQSLLTENIGNSSQTERRVVHNANDPLFMSSKFRQATSINSIDNPESNNIPFSSDPNVAKFVAIQQQWMESQIKQAVKHEVQIFKQRFRQENIQQQQQHQHMHTSKLTKSCYCLLVTMLLLLTLYSVTLSSYVYFFKDDTFVSKHRLDLFNSTLIEYINRTITVNNHEHHNNNNNNNNNTRAWVTGDYKLSVSGNNHKDKYSNGSWLVCNGSFVLKSDYPNLYALIKNRFGQSESPDLFRLPNMTDQVIGIVNDNVNSKYQVGNKTGSEQVTLTIDQMPAHSHTYNHVAFFQNSGQLSSSTAYYNEPQTSSSSVNGSNQPFSVMQPTQFAAYLFIYAD